MGAMRPGSRNFNHCGRWGSWGSMTKVTRRANRRAREAPGLGRLLKASDSQWEARASQRVPYLRFLLRSFEVSLTDCAAIDFAFRCA